MILAVYPGVSFGALGKLTYRQYNSLLNQIPNVETYLNGGKLEMETDKDKIQRAKEEYTELKKKGIL